MYKLLSLKEELHAETFSIDYKNSKSWAERPSSLIHNAHE
jgi:hypothetical protein